MYEVGSASGLCNIAWLRMLAVWECQSEWAIDLRSLEQGIGKVTPNKDEVAEKYNNKNLKRPCLGHGPVHVLETQSKEEEKTYVNTKRNCE